MLSTIESELGIAGSPYFLDDFSLVDIVFAPFLERMDASLTFYKGFRMRGQGKQKQERDRSQQCFKGTYPRLEAWFAAMETRPAYIASRSDYYTHAFALPPQFGDCEITPEGLTSHCDGNRRMNHSGEPFAEKICGESGDAWTLPLEPLSATSFEPYAPGDNPSIDAYDAGLFSAMIVLLTYL